MKDTVLLFDGVCNLCNGMVHFVLKHEKGTQIKFGALQSIAGSKYLAQHHLDKNSLKSIVFIEDAVVYEKSEAVARVARYLKPPWSWFKIIGMFPLSVSNYFYDLIAKYRYRIFGKTESCMVPDSQWESRFLK